MADEMQSQFSDYMTRVWNDMWADWGKTFGVGEFCCLCYNPSADRSSHWPHTAPRYSLWLLEVPGEKGPDTFRKPKPVKGEVKSRDEKDED
jgi:hypothetical protein